MFGENDYIVYTVKSGDTLDKIAKKYRTTYQEIAKSNMINDPNKIEVGQELMIYTKAIKPVESSSVKSVKSVSRSAINNATSSFALPKISNSTINFALIGGIVALSIPLVVKIFGSRRQVA